MLICYTYIAVDVTMNNSMPTSSIIEVVSKKAAAGTARPNVIIIDTLR